jgi:hypothetical protein
LSGTFNPDGPSNLGDAQPDFSLLHQVAGAGPAGTAIAFDGRLRHGAGANTSAASRYGITTTCCGPLFRPLENDTRGMRPEALARLSAALRARLDFAAWSSDGHTGDPTTRYAGAGEEALGELTP